MRVPGHGAEAMFSKLLREEATRGASTGKNDSREEIKANSLSKAKQNVPCLWLMINT